MSQKNTFRPLQARRERRINRRRLEIMEVAAKIFSERGYNATTTKDIAQAVDIAEGTLYNYFASKRDILMGIVAEMQAAALETLDSAGAITREEDIVALVEKGLELLLSRLAFTRTLMTEVWIDDTILKDFVMQRVAQLRARIRVFITQYMDAGVFRAVDPEIASSMLLGMMIAPVVPVLRGVAPMPAPEARHSFAVTAVSILLNGLRMRAS